MSAQKSGSGLFYGYVIVSSTVVIFAAAFGVHYSFGLFFKPMASEFGWSRSMMSGAFSLSWLLHGIAAIFLGRWTDRYGPRVVLVFSAILLSSGYLLTTWINSPWQFYATYGVLVGIGTGGIYVPLVSTIARWFVVHRTRMTGIAVAGVGMGTFLVPLIANRLISAFGWRSTYEILGIAVFAIVFIFSLVLKRDPTLSGQHPDGARTVAASSAGVDGVGLSLQEALRSLKFWNICAQFFCFGYFTYSVLVHIAPYSTDQGLSTATAAYFVSVIGMASIIGKLLLGRLGDSIGNRNIYLLCFVMVMVAMASTLLLPTHWVGYPFVITVGLAYGGCSASHSPLIATHFGLRAHGQIIGAANNGYTIGATVGPLITGLLFDITGGYRLSFLLVAIAAGVGLLLSLFLKPTPQIMPCELKTIFQIFASAFECTG